MNKSYDVVFSSTPEQMGRILKLEEQSSEAWSADDLRAMVQHQLSTPLEFDLGGVRLSPQQRQAAIQALTAATRAGIKTFGDLFQNRQPPISVLKLSHKFFKPDISSSANLPQESKVAYLFYLTSIVVARIRCRERIAKLTEEQLLQGIKSMLALPWIDEGLRSLLSEVELMAVRSSEHSSSAPWSH